MKLSLLLAVLPLSLPGVAPALAQGARMVPTFTPVAGNTATNHPFSAAGYQATPIDLSALGYREDEYFVSGIANVYQYDSVADPFDTRVDTLRHGPYTNRILVRRPVDPARFSGNVVIEVINATNGYDLPIMWSFDAAWFTGHGDIWIGITGKPSTIAALKLFNPTRYAGLSWANPNPNETDATCPTATVANGDSHQTEDGLLWDILGQTATLARQTGSGSLLDGYTVKAVYATGDSQSAYDLLTYMNDIAPLASGTPVFDGFLTSGGAGQQAALNQCTTAPSLGDPRNVPVPGRSAAILVQSQTDYILSRVAFKADSDAAGNLFRYYEVAGGTHVTAESFRYGPDDADIHASGTSSLAENYAENCQSSATSVLSQFPSHFALDASFQSLENWVRSGIAPPHGQLITAVGVAPLLVPTLDGNGNVQGGVRTPDLDVPVASYDLVSLPKGSTLAGVCLLTGHETRFSDATLLARYPTAASYTTPYILDATSLILQGFVTPADARGAIGSLQSP